MLAGTQRADKNCVGMVYAQRHQTISHKAAGEMNGRNCAAVATLTSASFGSLARFRLSAFGKLNSRLCVTILEHWYTTPIPHTNTHCDQRSINAGDEEGWPRRRRLHDMPVKDTDVIGFNCNLCIFSQLVTSHTWLTQLTNQSGRVDEAHTYSTVASTDKYTDTILTRNRECERERGNTSLKQIVLRVKMNSVCERRQNELE